MSERASFSIDPDASHFAIEAQTSLLPIRAGASGIEGYLEVSLDPDGLVDPGKQPAGVMTFEVRRLEKANPVYSVEIEHLLDPRNHPTVVVDLSHADELDGGRAYVASGTITLRGVTQPLEGELTVSSLTKDRIELHGTKRLDVREFGIEPPHLFALRVHPDVTVRLDVVARRAG